MAPSPNWNRLNPCLDDDVYEALKELKWTRRVTWNDLFAWGAPILTKASKAEQAAAKGKGKPKTAAPR